MHCDQSVGLPQINVLRAGDYLSYDAGSGRQLHIVTTPTVRSDDAGLASIGIEPPIRTSPAAAAAIEITLPTCIMGFLDDDQAGVTYEPGIIGRSSVSLIERF
jgi:hypothetical protein